MTSVRISATASTLTATLGLAAACWVLAQKLLPAKTAVDVPLTLAIVGFGVLIVLAPSSVPGLTPPMWELRGHAGQHALL